MVERDFLAPIYEIRVNNQPGFLPLSIKQFIQSVVVEDDAELFNKITIEVSALSTTQRGAVIEFIDSKLFQPGNLIEILMGYGNVLQTVGAGHIVRANPTFDSSGPKLSITAYDPFYKLSQTKPLVGQSFVKTPDATVVGNILSKHGILMRTPLSSNDTNPPSRFQKKGQNDYQFIKSIANVLGFDLFVTFDPKKAIFTADFEPPTDKQNKIYTFEYFADEQNPDSTLLSFAPEMSTVDQATDFEIVAWSRKTKKKITTKLTAPEPETVEDIKFLGPGIAKKVPKITDARTLRFKAFGTNLEIVTTKPFKDEAAAKKFIEQFLKKRMNQFISGRGRIVGSEILTSRQKHEFSGLGELFTGKYFFERVVHRQGRGEMYICDVIARKTVENLSQAEGSQQATVTLLAESA